MMMNIRQNLGPGPGTYVLLLELAQPATIPVGRLGPVVFDTGWFVYTGSAFGPGGLAARVGRHLRRSKTCRWHIDYLRQFAQVPEIWYTFFPEKMECRWAAIFQETLSVRIIHRGFGSSDCGCDTHLFYFKRKPGIANFRRKTEAPVSRKGIAP